MIRNFSDHAANERTFLSWVRTAIAVVAFGMATARLSGRDVPLWSEVLLLFSGAIVVLVAYLRMRWLRARIAREEEMDAGSLAPDFFLVLLIVALLLLLACFGLHVG